MKYLESFQLFCESKNDRFISKDNCTVLSGKQNHHVHGKMKEILPDIIKMIECENRGNFFFDQIEFPYEIGKTTCVEIDETDDIVYAVRRGRKGYTKFVRNRLPESTKYVTVILIKKNDFYYVISAYIGPKSEVEPFDPVSTEKSYKYWENHALIFGTEPIYPSTLTTQVDDIKKTVNIVNESKEDDEFMENEEENRSDKIDQIQDFLQQHVLGNIDTINEKNLEILKDFFDGEIGYKYYGTVWKVFFFNDERYKIFLKNGIEKFTSQLVYSCTKNFDILDKIKDDLGCGYKYFITVELESTKESCLFDVNNICKDFSVNNPYDYEEEILLFADKVKITKDDIIDYGKLK